MGIELSPTSLSGWIRVESATHYDAGNYTCVPSYATPAWTDVRILHGEKFNSQNMLGNSVFIW